MIIFDKEIQDNIVSTLAYVWLSCGGKLKNIKDFNLIIYKLYNYLDLDYSNGIIITEDLKNKISYFKDNFESLENPVIDEGWQSIGIVTSSTHTNFEFETEYMDLTGVQEYKFEDYKFFVTPGEKKYIQVAWDFKRKKDGYKTTSRSQSRYITMPAGAVYCKIRLVISSSYTVFADFYGADDALISSSASWYAATSYKPSDYDIKLKAIYYSSGELEVFKNIKADFTIDLNNIEGVDTTKLINGDNYKAESVVLIDDFNVGCIYGKHLNDEAKDLTYEILKEMLGSRISLNENMPIRYITILKNEEVGKYYALLSDYEFFYIGTNGTTDCIGQPNSTSRKIYFKILESEDDKKYGPLNTYITGLTQVDGYGYTANTFVIEGCKVCYTNYNMLVSTLTKSGYSTDLTKRADWITSIFKKSDEFLTLGSAGVGTVIKFGSHKIEGSESYPLHFEILDNTERLNIQGEAIEGFIKRPDNAVLLSSVNIVDYLSMNAKNFKDEEVQNNNTLLHRWLNSNSRQWFSPVYEGDIPITEENAYVSAVGYHFNHRPGFLTGFSPEEQNAMLRVELENGYKGKIFLPEQNETVSYNLKTQVNPHFCNVGNLKRNKYKLKALKNHLKAEVIGVEGEEVEGNDLFNSTVINSTNTIVWTRTMDDIGYYHDCRTSSTGAHRGNGIAPVFYLSADTPLVDNGDGTFSCILPELEFFDYETEMDILVSKSNKVKASNDLKKEIKVTKSIAYDSRREVTKIIKVVKDFDLSKITTKYITVGYDVVKTVVNNVIDSYRTSRRVKSIRLNTFGTVRMLSNNINCRLDTTRGLKRRITSFKDMLKKVSKDKPLQVDTLKSVKADKDKLFDSLREVKANQSMLNDTVRYVKFEAKLENDSERILKVNSKNLHDIAKEVRVESKNLYDSIREIKKSFKIVDSYNLLVEKYIDNIKKYEAVREVKGSCKDLLDTSKNIQINKVETLDINREIAKSIAGVFDTVRGLNYFITLSVDTIKKVYAYNLLQADLRRGLSTEEKNTLDTLKAVSKDAKAINDVSIEMLKTLNSLFDNNRVISIVSKEGNDLSRKVSKEKADTIDILKEIGISENKAFDLVRKLSASGSEVFDTVKEVYNCTNDIMDTNKEIFVENLEVLDTLREVITSIEVIDLYDLVIHSCINKDEEFDIDKNVRLEKVNLFDLSRGLRDFNKYNPVMVEEIVKETDDSGLSNYIYKPIKVLKCHIYDVKNTVEPLPALVTEKTRYIVITRDKSIKADYVINYKGKKYIIEAITRNRVFTEIYLKED